APAPPPLGCPSSRPRRMRSAFRQASGSGSSRCPSGSWRGKRRWMRCWTGCCGRPRSLATCEPRGSMGEVAPMPARSTLRTVAKKAAAPAPSSLHRILGDFASQRVLVVGDLVADHYVYGHTERVSREAPVLVVRHERSEVKLGGAANAAANLASLGARVRAVGLLGRDPMGESLTQAFKAQGIRLDAITSPKVVTETKTRILAGGLSTTRQQVVRLDQGALEPPPPSLRERLARTVARVAAQ